MPTIAQLADIANYVYNTSGIGSNVYGLTLDTDKVAQLGFSIDSTGYFYVWSEEYSYNGASARYFAPTYTYSTPYGRVRNLSNYQAVCLGD